jgi:signal transduction histidine kinase
MLDTAIETLQPQIDERKHRLTVERRARGVVITGDAHRITQVLVNLLSNAVRYTPSGGEIGIAMDRDDTSVTSACATTAAASSPSSRNAYSTCSCAAGTASPTRAAGSVSGLALSRKIVELHGGSDRCR